MADSSSTLAHNACALVDGGGMVHARQAYDRASTSTGYGSLGKSTASGLVGTSRPINAVAWPSRSTKPPESSITTGASVEDGSSWKATKAFRAVRRIFSPSRSTQECQCSTEGAGGETHPLAYVAQPKRVQTEKPSPQNNDLPRSVQNHPVRSAMRGARPKKVTDSYRHVHFAEQTGESSEQKDDLPRSPRRYPLRSALRGSRPRQEADSSRHVHFASGSSGRRPGDTDA